MIPRLRAGGGANKPVRTRRSGARGGLNTKIHADRPDRLLPDRRRGTRPGWGRQASAHDGGRYADRRQGLRRRRALPRAAHGCRPARGRVLQSACATAGSRWGSLAALASAPLGQQAAVA